MGLKNHDTEVDNGLNIFIDIQTSKTLIQMDINKMMTMEFIQWRVNTYSQKLETKWRSQDSLCITSLKPSGTNEK